MRTPRGRLHLAKQNNPKFWVIYLFTFMEGTKTFNRRIKRQRPFRNSLDAFRFWRDSNMSFLARELISIRENDKLIWERGENNNA